MSARKIPHNRPRSDKRQQPLGGAKEIANTFARRAAADLSESAGVSFVKEGRVIDLAEEGRDILPLDEAELPGARIVRDSQAAAAAVSTIMALSTRLRSLVRNPEQFAADFKRALTHAQSEAEAMGKAGLAQAKRRLRHETDGGYIDRYHGPDDMTRKGGRLAEWEGKGANTDSESVAKNVFGDKQGSKDKNLLRAEIMVGKAKKIGQPSNRQGGPYTQGEIDLWREVEDLGGNKQHISVHTNTQTGRVRVYERDHRGKIAERLDDFQMENFEAMKQAIKEAFKR